MSRVMWHLVPTEREDSLHKGTFHLYTEVAAARCSSLQQPSPVTTYSLWHKTLIWKFKSVQVAKYGSSLSLCKVQHRWAVALLAQVARCNEKNLLYFWSHLPISTPFPGQFVLCIGPIEKRHCGKVFAQSIWWTTLGLDRALHPSHHFCWNFGLVSSCVDIM